MLEKFHRNILNLSENIAKSFRGATFFDSHCRPNRTLIQIMPQYANLFVNTFHNSTRVLMIVKILTILRNMICKYDIIHSY